MAYLIVKYAVTALIIVIVSEVAKHYNRLGALIASLPFVTILAMIWLYVEKQPSEKIASHAYYTFWYVLPTLPMFLLFPVLMRKGVNFWLCLGSSAVLTFICFGLTVWLAKRFGVELMP